MLTDNNIEQPDSQDSHKAFSANEAFLNYLEKETPQGTTQTQGNKEATIEPTETEEVEETETQDHSDEQDQNEEVEYTDNVEESDDPWASVIQIGDEERTAKEWHDGFMKSKDYTQKTQALAEHKNLVETREKEIEQLQERSAAVLGMFTKQAENEVKAYQNVDWTTLLDSDQQSYMKHKAKYDTAKEKLKNLQDQAVQFFNQLENVNKEKRQREAQVCIKELRSEMPNWNDDLYADLVDYGVKKGLKDDFLLNSTDPALFKMLNKAKKYDSMKKTARKKKAAPRKVITNTGTRKSKVEPSKVQNAMGRLQRSNSRHDAADAFSELLKDI